MTTGIRQYSEEQNFFPTPQVGQINKNLNIEYNCFSLFAEAFYDTNYIASKGGEV